VNIILATCSAVIPSLVRELVGPDSLVLAFRTRLQPSSDGIRASPAVPPLKTWIALVGLDGHREQLEIERERPSVE